MTRLAAWGAFLVPAWFLVWSAHAMWLAYSPTPFNDQWINIFWWREAPKSGWLTYLFSQHNEHRIFFPRLVFLADWKWFQGRDGLNLLAIGLIQLAGAAFFLKVACLERLRTLGLLGLAVALALIFSLLQWENLFWGFQVQFVGVYAAAAWGLYLFCLVDAEPGRRLRWDLMAGAIALLVIATFNMANGVFAGAAMVAVGIVTRQRPAAIVTAAVATAVLLAAYLHGYHPVSHHAPSDLALHHPGRFVTYVAIYLGNIWFPGRPPYAAVMGLLGAGAAGSMLLVLARQSVRDPVRSSLFGVVLFIGLTAAVTSLGRLNFGVGQAMSSRYMTPTAYFWAAQALFWALTFQHSPRRVLRGGLAVALFLAVLRLVGLQQIGDVQLMATRERILVGSSALLGGIEDRQALLGLYPELSTIQDVVPFMRQTHISLFADPPPAAVGEAFNRPAATATSVCRGAFDILAPAPEGRAWRAVGWGWDLKARRAFDRVVLVDSAGKVLGIGMSGVPRRDVREAVRDVTRLTTGWIASINRGANGEVVAYGITAAGQACELGRKVWPQ